MGNCWKPGLTKLMFSKKKIIGELPLLEKISPSFFKLSTGFLRRLPTCRISNCLVLMRRKTSSAIFFKKNRDVPKKGTPLFSEIILAKIKWMSNIESFIPPLKIILILFHDLFKIIADEISFVYLAMLAFPV